MNDAHRVRRLTTLVLFVAGLLAGCSTGQLHAAGQAWRRSLCEDTPNGDGMRCRDQVDRERN